MCCTGVGRGLFRRVAPWVPNAVTCHPWDARLYFCRRAQSWRHPAVHSPSRWYIQGLRTASACGATRGRAQPRTHFLRMRRSPTQPGIVCTRAGDVCGAVWGLLEAQDHLTRPAGQYVFHHHCCHRTRAGCTTHSPTQEWRVHVRWGSVGQAGGCEKRRGTPGSVFGCFMYFAAAEKPSASAPYEASHHGMGQKGNDM